MGLFDVLGELAGAFLGTAENCDNCKYKRTERVWNGSGFSWKTSCLINKHAQCSSTYVCKHFINRNRGY